jgi:hypothetical protein
MWEVALRNKLNAFLVWKFGPKWPYDEHLLRGLKISEQKKLNETKTRLISTSAKGWLICRLGSGARC